MKRSQINAAIDSAMRILEENAWKLPEFAYWSTEQWHRATHDLANLKKIGLGWDVTDFGLGDFDRVGGVLFTLRNGHLEDKSLGTPYAEKLIILRHGTAQALPTHFHRLKTEDIINRAGGVMVMRLHGSTPTGELDTVNPIVVKMDGIPHELEPGASIEVEKGASVTLSPGLYHSFWAKEGCGDLIVGEVSSINDDNTDNIFLEKNSRFSQIEEDEPARYLLCNEYDSL